MQLLQALSKILAPEGAKPSLSVLRQIYVGAFFVWTVDRSKAELHLQHLQLQEASREAPKRQRTEGQGNEDSAVPGQVAKIFRENRPATWIVSSLSGAGRFVVLPQARGRRKPTSETALHILTYYMHIE